MCGFQLYIKELKYILLLIALRSSKVKIQGCMEWWNNINSKKKKTQINTRRDITGAAG